MKQKYSLPITKFTLCAVLLFSFSVIAFAQGKRVEKAQALYDSLKVYQIEYPQTVLATALVETGWMECKDCSMNMNNLFGFRSSKGYVSFKNLSECLDYLKKWQDYFYTPWKNSHPNGNYYDFLNYMRYAENMPFYIKNVKNLERWVFYNLETERAGLD